MSNKCQSNKSCFNSFFNSCSCGREEEAGRNNENTFLSKEGFNALSDQEKDGVFVDVYGMGGADDAVNETPELIADKLQELHEALDNLPKRNKISYMKALEEEDRQRTLYVRSTPFLIMFLRSEKFDSIKTAKRIVNFFDLKQELFGNEKLPHKITQADLSDDDKKSLYNGSMYVEHNMDHAGRTLFFVHVKRWRDDNRAAATSVNNFYLNEMRSSFYVCVSAMEGNEDAQKKGVIFITHMTGAQLYPYNEEKKFAELAKKFEISYPARASCFHFTTSSFKNSLSATIYLLISSPFIQARILCHYGNQKKIHHELQRYGIEVHRLPITSYGKCDEDMIRRALRKLLRKEENDSNNNADTTSMAADGDDDTDDDIDESSSLGSY